MKKTLTLAVALILIWGYSSATTAEEVKLPKSVEHKLKEVCAQTGHHGSADHLIGIISNYISMPKQTNEKQGITLQPFMNEMINKFWDMNMWNYNSRTLEIYDVNQLNTDFYEYAWNNNQWEVTGHGVYTYNAQSMPVSILFKTWDGSAWTDFYQIDITYNANNSPSEYLLKINFLGSWMDYLKIIFTYNAQDQLTEMRYLEYDMITTTWENDSRSLFTYDTNGWETEELMQTWDGSTWENDEKSASSYNAQGYIIEKVYAWWYNNMWETSSRLTYTYDAQWNVTQMLEEYWSTGTWAENWLYTYTYDGLNRILEELTQMWDGTAWENDEIDIWTYGLPIGINSIKTEQLNVNIYPNPASTFTIVEFATEYSTEIAISILDATGRLVSKETGILYTPGAHTVTIQTSELTPGYYFLTLSNQAGLLSTKKLVIF